MHTEMRMPWVVVVVPNAIAPPAPERNYVGDGHDVLLQGFHWSSAAGIRDARGHKNWYNILRDNAEAIKSAGFSWVWFPPPSDSLAAEGYIPRRWHVLDTPYGSEAELRAAIEALGPVKAMADLVLNHRVGAHTAGADFEAPPFPDNRRAIARNDESGVGTGNHDTGELYAAGRDLDHTNHEVRTTVKQFLGRLKDVGFRGWRYDFVKGYHGRFVGEYNDASAPELSVGEYYSTDRQQVTDWIDATGGKSTAFDFPTRYMLYEACIKDEYSHLRSRNAGRVVPGGLIGFWPSRTMTFLDNHDTEYRRDTEYIHSNNDTRHFPGKTVEMGYAYLLTHPGVPCVFWSHFFDWGPATRQKIETLIKIRQQQRIHASSQVDIREARTGLYAAIIDGKVAVKLGSRDWNPGHDWHCAAFGDKFAVWTRR